MSRTTSSSILFFSLLLAGCGASGGGDRGEELDHFASMLEGDLELWVTQIEDLADSAGALSDESAREQATDCYDLQPGCTVCYELDGGYLSGTFTAGLENTPCTAGGTLRGLSAESTLTRADLLGDWSADNLAGDYTITMTGGSDSTLVIEGPRSSYDYSSSFDLVGLSATTAAFELATYDISLLYTGFADDSWTVSATGTTTEVTGTVTSTSGVSCVVSGTPDAVDVSCS